MAVERPLDALNAVRGGNVVVELKNGKTMRGKLLAYDIHINLVLDETEELVDGQVSRKLGRILIRGDTVIIVHVA
ncbi:MAG: small nuclear ribonucleoprotein [Candidatus Altiarchaeota archaeon]|nr:small nuclear ribonucleoprotein [Candidatus Altiarchaeota archaeon]